MGSFEILEHTADIGIRAAGASLTEIFEQATRGLADIAGIWRPGDGDERRMEVEARDVEGVLVGWLGEVIYLHDSRNLALTGVRVEEVADTRAVGTLGTRALDGDGGDGIQIKAVTYHQLAVEKTADGFRATVFFDI